MPAFYFEFLYYIAVRHCCVFFLRLLLFSRWQNSGTHIYTYTQSKWSNQLWNRRNVLRIFASSSFLPLHLYFDQQVSHRWWWQRRRRRRQKSSYMVVLLYFHQRKVIKWQQNSLLFAVFSFGVPFLLAGSFIFSPFFIEHEWKKLQLEFRGDENNTNLTQCLYGMNRETYVEMHFLSAKDE